MLMCFKPYKINTAIVYTIIHCVIFYILYVLQPFYTINVNFRLLQPDTDFIGVSNIQVCLGQVQMNTNTISGARGGGQGWHMKSSSPFKHETGLSKSGRAKKYFHTFFHST
jgi:hypothetical protein